MLHLSKTMHSSYSLSKRLVYLNILAIQFLLVPCVTSLNLTNAYLHHKCRVSEGKYKPRSKYEENLNYLIKSVSTNSFQNGFIHISYGEAPNSVTIIFQCRGDSYRSNCRSCYTIVVAELRRRCERNKGGVIWYDQCFLDISMINRRTPRKNDYKDTFFMHNPKSVTGDIELFNKKTKDFLDMLILKADKADDIFNLINYAAGKERYGSMKLYAMVQCAKDIVDCKVCLEWNIKELSKCCNGKQGARVLSTSCNLRYELYPFLRT